MLFTSRSDRRLWSAAGLCVALIWLSLSIARPAAEALRERNLLRLSVALAFLAAAGFIAWRLSILRPGRRTLVAAAVVAIAYLLLLVAVPMMPEERLHFLQYGTVAVLVYLALRERHSHRAGRVSPFLAAAVLTASLGWVDEGIQAVLPNRYYDLRDVAFNSAAGVLALVSLKLIEKARADE